MNMKTLTSLMVCLFLVGCGTGEKPRPAQSASGDSTATGRSSQENTKASAESPANSADTPAEESADGGNGKLSIHLLSWQETKKLVAEKKPKLVVLDVWSTYCGPCIREFPGLVKLHKLYQDKVACISLNLNYDGSDDEPSDELKKEVRDFLTKQGADFENVICSDPDEEFYKMADLGAIPAVYVFNQQGKLSKRFDNDKNEYGDEGFTYEQHIIPLVEKLIGSK